MIGIEEAQARMLALGRAVDVETLSLVEAAGRWAAEPVAALRAQPTRDLSAMDGYAIRHADLPGPWRVIGESAAGRPFAQATGTGEAVRIFTGAALPVGSDTIVIQEDVARDGDRIVLAGDGPGASGTHVRFAGYDFQSGTTLIERGDRFTPARVALAAMGGHGTVAVRRPIRVALVSTGDELVEAGENAGKDRLPASNAPMLAALLGDLPVIATDCGIVRDDMDALVATLAALGNHDIVVTTGGASVGDHDLVRPALLKAGATLDFWKVAMRPGKPLMAGTLGNAVILGLPGNPVSAFVTAHLFLRPLVAHLAGANAPLPRRVGAELGEPLPAVGNRTDFVRAKWSERTLVPVRPGDSGAVAPLADAQALIVRLAGAPAIAKGTRIEAILIA